MWGVSFGISYKVTHYAWKSDDIIMTSSDSPEYNYICKSGDLLMTSLDIQLWVWVAINMLNL